MKKINNKIKRKLRNRKKLKNVNTDRYRISVSKSLNNLSAQIIDDKVKKTLVSVSSIEKEINEAKKTFTKYKWPTIDVTRKSVEETAASIIKIYEINKNNG